MNLNELKSPRAVLPLAGWDAVILNFKMMNLNQIKRPFSLSIGGGEYTVTAVQISI